MVAGVREADSEVSSSWGGTGEGGEGGKGGKLSWVVLLSACCIVSMLAVSCKEEGREIYEAAISNGCLVNSFRYESWKIMKNKKEEKDSACQAGIRHLKGKNMESSVWSVCALGGGDPLLAPTQPWCDSLESCAKLEYGQSSIAGSDAVWSSQSVRDAQFELGQFSISNLRSVVEWSERAEFLRDGGDGQI